MDYPKNHISRREFLRNLGAVGLAAIPVGKLFGASFAYLAEAASGRKPLSDSRMHFERRELKAFNARFNAKGLPVRELGRTGVVVPRMGLGLGSRFCGLALKDEQTAVDMLNYALDNGFYYWDTAPIYTAADSVTGREVVSEHIAGLVTKYRRNEIFLNSKMSTRDPDEMERSMENTLRMLGTDNLDMLMIHAVQNSSDVDLLLRDRIIDRLERMREQKLFRLLGFSCHDEAEAIRDMVGTGRFDVVLMAVDPYRYSVSGPREDTVSLAASQGMGVMLMKTVRGYEDRPGTDFNETIRRCLEMPGATGAMVGMDSKEIVDKNIALLRSL